ncbi:GNAT family N-acetyltransferase [Azospirillum picis]|uniref:L-amino acid N-acyltransferase YncA n=1 Tax=Azospirillum picis TaxID=488438 RepID=A0ABU0MTH1_9PROT|nr:GNAT family N-acetyltransferase [Azospirillum picis]MBP2303003.1 L-amino acid N-acyltransferase YncA [Azospirillum picis]MDQ0536755.1 L-amino acid N-acyltransferase YncA [Azospirillum picis]
MTDSAFPSGIAIREARADDAPGMARVHVQSWRSTYPGLIPAQFLVNLAEAPAARRWASIAEARAPGQGALVAVDVAGVVAAPGTIVGISSFGTRRVAVQDHAGEFHALYLLDDAKGRGIGRRLMAGMADRMLAAGIRSAVVWCLRDNPSRWFYERLGGIRLAERPIRFAAADLVEIAYGWRDLTPLARLSAGPEVR